MLKETTLRHMTDDRGMKHTIVVVDDDAIISTAMIEMLQEAGFATISCDSAEALLATDWASNAACLLLDVGLPGICGVDALRQLRAMHIAVPVVMITGAGDVPTAVAAMKAGAGDFIEKPASDADVLAAIDRALNPAHAAPRLDRLYAEAAQFVTQLTARQRQILDMIVEGCPNKIIASDLGISQRTVEGHRAEIMQKSGVKSLPALTRMMFACSLAPSQATAMIPQARRGARRRVAQTSARTAMPMDANQA